MESVNVQHTSVQFSDDDSSCLVPSSNLNNNKTVVTNKKWKPLL